MISNKNNSDGNFYEITTLDELIMTTILDTEIDESQIIHAIEVVTKGKRSVRRSLFRFTLHKLQKAGMIEARWQYSELRSESKEGKHFYSLTHRGTEVLQESHQILESLRNFQSHLG
jgi:DNA-binding PadR family transcriptional regulator